MRAETLEILCSPLGHAPLKVETRPSLNGHATQFLVDHEHGLEFPIRDGIRAGVLLRWATSQPSAPRLYWVDIGGRLVPKSLSRRHIPHPRPCFYSHV